MYFCHSNEIWRDYPELVAGVLLAQGVTKDKSIASHMDKYFTIATSRLAISSEGEMPEVQAWRRVFSRMGLKPTQYRCASESLLRRFRKEKSLPRLHPLIDLCNAISLAFAIPVAVFDVARIREYLQVRYATGSEVFLAFSGEVENPQPGEVIFADDSGSAHARRWTHRQSGFSAVQDATSTVLVVAEGMHSSARADVERLLATAADDLKSIWAITARTGILSEVSPRFDY